MHMDQPLASYLFRYVNNSGEVIRTTLMLCEADEDAIHKARVTMNDQYAMLEIFDGDRLVYAANPLAENA
jgi:hypothetical protein